MNEQKKLVKHRIRNDVILVAALLLAATLGFIYLFMLRSPGDEVVVTVNGEFFGSYSLTDNARIDILSGEDHSGRNLLVIRDGKAYVETATCPDGICVGHRPIFRSGESIICLPNGIVITVVSDTDRVDLDVIA